MWYRSPNLYEFLFLVLAFINHKFHLCLYDNDFESIFLYICYVNLVIHIVHVLISISAILYFLYFLVIYYTTNFNTCKMWWDWSCCFKLFFYDRNGFQCFVRIISCIWLLVVGSYHICFKVRQINKRSIISIIRPSYIKIFFLNV